MSLGAGGLSRSLVGSLVGMSLVLGPTGVPAAGARSPAQKIQSHRYDDGLGLTVELRLDYAPYGARKSAPGRNTVMVFLPWFYLWDLHPARGRRGIDTLVFFHGHGARADWTLLCPAGCRSRRGHYLREQVVAARQNMMLLVPQGPWMTDSSSGGRLDDPDGLLELMTEVRKVMTSGAMNAIRRSVASKVASSARQSDHAGLSARLKTSWGKPMDQGIRIGRLSLAAHSGGYKVLANCLARGGLEAHEVYLFDGLYGELRSFRDWLLATEDIKGDDKQWWMRHRLVSYQGSTQRSSGVADGARRLMKMLDRAAFPYARETARSLLKLNDFERASAVFTSRSRSVDHHDAVQNGRQLEDCLVTSAYTRLRVFKEVERMWDGQYTRPRTIDKPRRSP